MKTFIIMLFAVITIPVSYKADLRTEIVEEYPGTCKRKKKDICVVEYWSYRNREWIPGNTTTTE